MIDAVYRSLWGFVMYVPFCYFWGVDNFTWFSVVGTFYFVGVNWIYDRFRI